jgi:hypothetical protein
VFTNTTYHTICDSFITVDTKDVYVKGADIKVFPNPATESINFEVVGIEAQSYALLIYDIQGRLITNQFFDHPNFRLLRQQLPAGTFIYQLAADGKLVASGKIIVQ